MNSTHRLYGHLSLVLLLWAILSALFLLADAGIYTNLSITIIEDRHFDPRFIAALIRCGARLLLSTPIIVLLLFHRRKSPVESKAKIDLWIFSWIALGGLLSSLIDLFMIVGSISNVCYSFVAAICLWSVLDRKKHWIAFLYMLIPCLFFVVFAFMQAYEQGLRSNEFLSAQFVKTMGIIRSVTTIIYPSLGYLLASHYSKSFEQHDKSRP